MNSKIPTPNFSPLTVDPPVLILTLEMTPKSKIPPKINKSLNEELQKTGFICSHFWGIFYSLLSGCAFASAALLVKFLPDYNACQIALYRSFGPLLFGGCSMLALSCIPSKRSKVSTTKSEDVDLWRNGFLLTICGFATAAATVANIQCIKYLDIGDVYIIHGTTPIFASIGANLVLKEECSFTLMILIVMTMAGVGVVARPPILTGADTYNMNFAIGVALCILGALTSSLIMVIFRYLRNVHWSTTLFVVSAWGCCLHWTTCILLGERIFPETLLDIELAITSAFFSAVAVLALIVSLRFDQVALIVVCSKCDLLFALALQALFLSVWPDTYSLIGCGLIASAVALTAFRKWISSLEANDNMRIKLGFLLK